MPITTGNCPVPCPLHDDMEFTSVRLSHEWRLELAVNLISKLGANGAEYIPGRRYFRFLVIHERHSQKRVASALAAEPFEIDWFLGARNPATPIPLHLHNKQRLGIWRMVTEREVQIDIQHRLEDKLARAQARVAAAADR